MLLSILQARKQQHPKIRQADFGHTVKRIAHEELDPGLLD